MLILAFENICFRTSVANIDIIRIFAQTIDEIMRLIDKYTPSDYCDSVSRRIKPMEPLTPDHIFEQMFCNFPRPVDWLMKLRNAMVKKLFKFQS